MEAFNFQILITPALLSLRVSRMFHLPLKQYCSFNKSDKFIFIRVQMLKSI